MEDFKNKFKEFENYEDWKKRKQEEASNPNDNDKSK